MNLKNQRVAVYARFSSDRQRETSIEDQIRRCVAFVKANGGIVDPTLVFADAAISGSTMVRPGFEALMTATQRKTARVEVIVTEDMSRISRDFADSANIFKRLQFAKIPLVGVADGIDTSQKGAKMAFTLKSLMSDLYLDDLRDKTMRGLEGRALAGMATGAVPFGFRTVEQKNSFGRVEGKRIEIHPDQAKLVREIFQLYMEGQSIAGIAHTLNARNVDPPRGKSANRLRGWVDSTIRAILYNEKYSGTWTFGKTTWVRDPSSGKRNPDKTGATKPIVLQRPELALIDRELFDAVTARLADVRAFYTAKSDGSAKGRAIPGGHTDHPLSSLLTCGVCKGPMNICGSAAGYYRCDAYAKRRTCTNGVSVREDKALAVIVGGIRDVLTTDKAIAYARKQAVAALAKINRDMRGNLDEISARLKRTEDRIHGLVEFIATGDRSDYVTSTLKDLEAQARTDKGAIKAIEANAAKPIPLPTPADVTGWLTDVEQSLKASPVLAREALRALFNGGTLELTPQDDGSYVFATTLYPFAVLAGKGKGRTYQADMYGHRSGGPLQGPFTAFSLVFSGVLPAVMRTRPVQPRI